MADAPPRSKRKAGPQEKVVQAVSFLSDVELDEEAAGADLEAEALSVPADDLSSVPKEEMPTSERAAGTWLFYSTAGRDEAWVADIRVGEMLFWWSGTVGSRLPNNGGRLQRGDTVLLLVDQSIVAAGVVAAEADLALGDVENRRRWPVLPFEVYSEPISRRRVEAEAGKLIPNAGAFHSVSTTAMEVINRLRAQRKLDRALPLHRESARQALIQGEPLERALDRVGTILAVRTSGQVDQDRDDPKPAERPDLDARTRFIEDAPSETEDRLDRGPIALFLARRLHLIWCEMNGCSPDSARRVQPGLPWDRDNFIIHVDSPWGGGKTTFANFVARALNPGRERIEEGHFLFSSLSAAAISRLAKSADRTEIFAADFGEAFKSEDSKLWARGRRPWIIARYNAWREQSAQPPWWQIFWSTRQAIHQALRDDGRLLDRCAIEWRLLRYKLMNAKLRAQAVVVGVSLLLLLSSFLIGPVAGFLGLNGPEAAKNLGPWLTLLGAGGLGLIPFLGLVGQSLSPDLEFTAESKHLGVADPIGRFRRMFDDILRRADRPVLLIVDDLDRCEPKTVVEVLRGLQTIVRSPRMFVMVLGDRNWIETAHQTYHKEMGDLAVGSETRLGARFVEKVFQLSFRLPAIKPEVRDLYTRGTIARGAPAKPTAAAAETRPPPTAEGAQQPQQQQQQQQQQQAPPSQVEAAMAAFEARLDEILADATRISQREALISEAKATAAAAGCDAAALDDIASRRMVAAAGADASHQSEVSSILVALADSLPGNPRQIKRIMNTFAVYETVGRIHFNYQLSDTGEGGAERAKRWRQLALWVTLATEWPETWRAIARRPDLIDVAFGPAKGAAAREKAFIDDLEDGQAEAMKAALARIKAGRTLKALLTGAEARPDSLTPGSAEFAATRMEPEAVREFNRIIWEPGFETHPRAASPRRPPPASA